MQVVAPSVSPSCSGSPNWSRSCCRRQLQSVSVGLLSFRCCTSRRRSRVGRVAAEERAAESGSGRCHPSLYIPPPLEAELPVNVQLVSVGLLPSQLNIPPPFVGGRVARERAVGQRRAAVVVVVHPAAPTCGRVVRERAVAQGRAAVVVVHPAAAVGGRVVRERRSWSRRRAAAGVVHPAAVRVGRVARERAVGQASGCCWCCTSRRRCRPSCP